MAERRLIDDCFVTDSERLRHDEALRILRERVATVVDAETVPLADALNRILAVRVTSPRDVPAFDNAAVDGYAFAAADYDAAGGYFPVVARLAAGHASAEPHMPGTAVRIFTGAAMPKGADTVAMQEDCEPHVQDAQAFVAIPPGLKPGANRRMAGEDLPQGATVVEPGTRLRPQEVAAIASTGLKAISAYGRLKVAVISTGDEIVSPGEPLKDGQVYDANAPLLAALLTSINCETTQAGILLDDPKAVERTLTMLAADHHAILSTGGASQGEEDHLAQTLAAVGKRHLWQIAIKPGRPMGFGQIGDCAVVALPGNPVAAFVCFLIYVRPMLTQMAGGDWPEPQRFQIPADFDIATRKAGRREFLRGLLSTDEADRPVVRKFPRDGSGLITSLREADGLIEIAEDIPSVRRGELVTFLPFSGLGLAP